MLRISKTLELPLDYATQTVAILARKRVGKTYTASVIAEECCENHIPFVVLDPTGAWWGLRSSADGKKAGYSVVIIGGQHGDIPLEFTAGAQIAEFIVANPGYYVLDLSLSQSNAEQDKFATAFAERLYRLKAKHKDPLHLFVDEADSFAPQSPYPGQQTMLGAFEAIVRRGGIRGLGMTMITQRSAVLNNNVLMQAEVLITLQTTGPADIAAVDKWVKLNATKEQREQYLSSLASLQQGEAWVWSPGWLQIFERVNIRTRRTFNSSATPEVGSAAKEPAKLASVDLEALKTSMATTIEKAKAEDPKLLKQELAKTKAELVKLQNAKPAVETKTETVEIAVFPASLKADLDKFAGKISGRISAVRQQLEVLVGDYVDEWTAIVDKHGYLPSNIRLREPGPNSQPAPAKSSTPPPMPVKTAASSGPSSTGPAREVAQGALTGPEQKIVDTLRQFETLGKDEMKRGNLAAMVGYSESTKSFKNSLSSLHTAGLITYSGPGLVSLTDAGRGAANASEEVLDQDSLIAAWKTKLSGPEGRMLDLLIDARPGAIVRADLADKVGYSESTKSFKNGLSHMRSLGLIDYGKEGTVSTVFVTDLLFALD